MTNVKVKITTSKPGHRHREDHLDEGANRGRPSILALLQIAGQDLAEKPIINHGKNGTVKLSDSPRISDRSEVLQAEGRSEA